MESTGIHIRRSQPEVPHTYVSISPVEQVENNSKVPEYIQSVTPVIEGKRPRWKPLTLKTPFVLFFFLVTVSFIAIIEFLNRKSQKNKALIFVGSLGDLTAWEQFSYRYLLTIVSVLYGMVWASVDLDVKRLEPFFQLSRKGGATAADSILLHYPFDFLATVPITALARRHYSVFSSGFALILIFWVITPMQAALLASSSVKRDIPTKFVPSMELIPFLEQNKTATVQYFFNSFGTLFLGERMQPWTNESFLAMPFKPVESAPSIAKDGMKETWTAVTRLYSTNLDCTLGFPVNNATQKIMFTNGDGCVTDGYTPIASDKPSRNIIYEAGLGHQEVVIFTTTTTPTAEACKEDSHKVTIIWAQTLVDKPVNGSLDLDMTAIICKPSYYYTDTEVTVDSETYLIQSMTPGDPVKFTQDDGIIDLDYFEADMGTASSLFNALYSTNKAPARDPPFNLENPTKQVSYLLGSSPDIEFESLKDPNILAETFNKGQKYIFANYVSSYLRNSTGNSTETPVAEVTGYRTVDSLGIVVIRVFAYLIEGFLAVVAICFAALGVIAFRRRANLFSDPDSLAAKMALVADSKPLLQDFNGLDETPVLKGALSDRVYRLQEWDGGYYKIDLDERLNNGSSIGSSTRSPVPLDPNQKSITRPLVLRTSIGIVLTIFLLGLFAFLIYLWDYAGKNNGLPTLSQNQIVVQIIFSVIPTILATGLEPLWVLITRYACVYQPYTELYTGRATSTASLSTKYTSVPPALVLFRALRAKHFILFSLSATSLMCNLLAVSLGGLFDNEPRPFDIPRNFTQTLSPLVNALKNQDKNYYMELRYADYFAADTSTYTVGALLNITQGAELPSWVAGGHYFLPFEWDESENMTDSHTATTRGFKLSLDCKAPESPIKIINHDELNFNVTLPTNDGRTVLCTKEDTYARMIGISGKPGDKLAGEYYLALWPALPEEMGDKVLRETCRGAIFRGWSRVVRGDGGFVADTFEHVTTLCQQKIETSMFEITVNGEKKVQSYKKIGTDDDPTQFFNGTITPSNFTAQISNAIMGGSSTDEFMTFHTGVDYTESWGTYLIREAFLPNISSVTSSLPDFDAVSNALGSIWSLQTSLLLSTNPTEAFFTESTPRSITGTTTITVSRVKVDKTMFYITAVILILNAIVAIITYTFRTKSFLPRFPDTLASEIAYFYSSKALVDVSGTTGMTSAVRDRHLVRLGHRYGFGYFEAEDFSKHRGVERSSILEDYMSNK